ncbi:MAG: hypothetical protein DMF49_04585 [Acidobacteria bacterium]|nr:MAG: hypothetical protein DMF49_04585 [Acidobacteriota bacterium]
MTRSTEYHGQAPPREKRTRIIEVRVRTILNRTGGFLAGFDYSLQPYRGCQLSCAYCYVREMAVQKTNRYRLPWAEWLEVKVNAPEVLATDAARGRIDGARIFCSSSTDPYVPVERRYRITRDCLEVISRCHPARFVLQTRMPGVLEDAPLIAAIPNARVHLTITTDNETVRKLLEPDSPSTARRLAMAKELRGAGIPVIVTVSPLLPCDPRRLARMIDPVADGVVIDTFFAGDGAGGQRSRDALLLLERAGYGGWTRPGYEAEALNVFRMVLGPERVGFSRGGFVKGIPALDGPGVP